MWTPDPVKLRWPLKRDNDETVTELALRPICYAEYTAAEKPARGNDHKLFCAFAKLAAGLSDDEIRRLSRPDGNTLGARLADLVAQRADHFRPEDEQDGDAFERLTLLVPITTDAGLERASVDLTVPTMGATQIMESQADDEQKTLFITMHCTGLSAAEVGRLALPDWNALQGVLNRFLNDGAESFQVETLTHSLT